MPDFSPNIPAPQYPTTPQSQGYGGGGTLGNPLDLMTKWQNLETQRLQQKQIQQAISSAQQAQDTDTANALDNFIGKLGSNPTDEELNRGKLNFHSRRGVNYNMVDSVFSQFPPMPKGAPGDPEYDRVIGIRNNIVDDARKRLIAAENLDTAQKVTTRDASGTPKDTLVRGGDYNRTPYPGTAGGGAPGYSGGLGTALRPEEAETFKQAGNEGTALLSPTLKSNLSAQKMLTHELIQLGDELGWKFSGPLGDVEKRLAGIAGNFGIPVADLKGLSRAQLYNKIYSQIVGKASENTRSVASLGVVQNANPTLEMAPEARRKAANQLLGDLEYQDATREEFERSGLPAHGLYNFMRNNPWLDQQVFRLNRMEGDERKTYLQSIGRGGRDRLTPLYNEAARRHYVE